MVQGLSFPRRFMFTNLIISKEYVMYCNVMARVVGVHLPVVKTLISSFALVSSFLLRCIQNLHSLLSLHISS